MLLRLFKSGENTMTFKTVGGNLNMYCFYICWFSSFFFYWLLQCNGIFWFVKAESQLTLATLLSAVGRKNPIQPHIHLKGIPLKEASFYPSSESSGCQLYHFFWLVTSHLLLSSIPLLGSPNQGTASRHWVVSQSVHPSSRGQVAFFPPQHLCWLWRIPSVSWIMNTTFSTVSKFQPLEWWTYFLDMYMEEPASQKCFRHLTKRSPPTQVMTVPMAPLTAKMP